MQTSVAPVELQLLQRVLTPELRHRCHESPTKTYSDSRCLNQKRTSFLAFPLSQPCWSPCPFLSWLAASLAMKKSSCSLLVSVAKPVQPLLIDVYGCQCKSMPQSSSETGTVSESRQCRWSSQAWAIAVESLPSSWSLLQSSILAVCVLAI